MKKIVSFFGENTEAFRYLNQKAEVYAKEKGFEYQWVLQESYDKETVVRTLQTADAGIIDIEPYDKEIFSRIYEKTKLLVRFGVGYDKVNLKDASQYGIAIARTKGANTLGVAEMALTLMLALRRKLRENHRMVINGAWEKLVIHETVGSTVGIIGFGAIGKAVARMVGGMGCKILAYDPNPDLEMMKALKVTPAEVDEVFANSDVVTIHMPLLPSTYGFVNEEKLKLMKETAVLINTSRGEIVDEEALYQALAGKRIAGAGLDVFRTEPLPATSPLCTLDNVILTPHTSSQTYESLWRIYKMAIDIAADFFAGKEPEGLLNPEYRVQQQNT